jgi:Rod binding domain-containing protein
MDRESGMDVGAIGSSRDGGAEPRWGLRGRQEQFSEVIGRSMGRGDAHQRARGAAEQFVAVTFVEPVLKQLRETSQAAPPFAPTRGEQQFRALLDARFAHEIVRAARFPLVDRLAADLLKRGGMGAAPMQKDGGRGAPPVRQDGGMGIPPLRTAGHDGS